MFPAKFPPASLHRRSSSVLGATALAAAVLLAGSLGMGATLWGQAQTSSPSTSQPQTKTPDKPTQESPAEAGGPAGDVGPIVIPKKKEAPPPEPVKRKPPEGLADYSMRVDVPVVNVDVQVLSKDGFLPGLKKENFRVLEDGVPQKVTAFSQSQAPITAVLVVEFAYTNYQFVYDALNASYTFANSLKPNDWVAVVSYDKKPRLLVDFTQNKGEVFGALQQLQIPMFTDTNMFDALYDTLDRLDRVEGRKYVVLIGSGVDSFSRITLDKAMKKVKETPDVGIFTISTGEIARIRADASDNMGPITRLNYLQADNQMHTFATMTGGWWYKPRFEGELPDIFRDIASRIRNQYSLAYHPSNAKQDGTYRKIKVELVSENGGPLQINVNGKPAKVTIIARDGYTAKHQVE